MLAASNTRSSFSELHFWQVRFFEIGCRQVLNPLMEPSRRARNFAKSQECIFSKVSPSADPKNEKSVLGKSGMGKRGNVENGEKRNGEKWNGEKWNPPPVMPTDGWARAGPFSSLVLDRSRLYHTIGVKKRYQYSTIWYPFEFTLKGTIHTYIVLIPYTLHKARYISPDGFVLQ